MALNLVNIEETESRLQNNVANKNRVQSNMVKLDRKLRDIKEENRKLKDEKTKLRRLKKEIDLEKVQLQTQKKAMQKQQEMMKHQKAKHKNKTSKLMVNESNVEQRKERKSLQRTLSQVSAELNSAKQKLMMEKRKSHGDPLKKLKTMERRYNAEKKNNKIMKRELDAIIAELAINKRKLNTAQRKGGTKGDMNGAKYKALLRKWMKAQKKLTLAMMEFEERANLYRRREAHFKKLQKKWLKQQKAMLKNKKMAVKYVFMDDISSIAIHNRYKNRIKVMTKNGKTMLVQNVKINHEKGKKTKGNDVSWMENDEIVQQLLDDIQSNDDDDEFDSQVIRGDVTGWKDEMMKRNEDMAILMSIAMNYNTDGDAAEDLNFDELITGIVERNKERFSETEGDEELKKDLENEKKQNEYNESEELLKTNCDAYLYCLQNAISSIQTIIETRAHNASNTNKLSIIKRKSMQSPSGESITSPITSPMSPISVPGLLNQHGLSPTSLASFDFCDDALAMFHPYTIAQELSVFYLDELDARSKDIKLMLEIFYSSYADKDMTTNLNDIMIAIDTRMDDVEDNDALVVKYIGNMERWKIQFQEYAMRMVIFMQELRDRREEMKQLFDVMEIAKQNTVFTNRIDSLSEKIDIRHQNVPNIVDNARYEVILGETKQNEDGDGDDEEKSNIDMDVMKVLKHMNGLQHENEEWKNFIDTLKTEAHKSSREQWKRNSIRAGITPSVTLKIIENCIKRSMEETNARTDDIKQLKLVLLSKDAETAGDLLNQIEDRHNDLNKTNDDIIKSNENCTQYCISQDNNSLWWKRMEDIVLNNKIMNKKRNKKSDHDTENHRRKRSESITLSLMRLNMAMDITPAVTHRKGTIRGVDYNENLSYIIQNESKENDNDNDNEKQTNEEVLYDDEFDEEDECWWLMLDENRNTWMESINITSATNNTLSKLSVYISRILSSETDKVTQLYVPIDLDKYPSSQFRALSTLFDGVIICKLLCLINEDYMDYRAIHKPNTDKAFPLKRNEINENVSVILSTLKSMRMNLNELYSVADWFNVHKHCELLMNILKQIASHTLDRFCSFKHHRELLLLKKRSEPVSSLAYINGEKWIIRWMNYLLNRYGIDNIDIDDDNVIKFNKDFIDILSLLKKRNSILLSNPNATKYENAKTFIKIAKTSFDIETCILAQDFVNNNRFCENYFAAQVFSKCNGLKLSQNMEMDMEMDEDADTDADAMNDDTMIAWLNSFCVHGVNSLDDINDGITLLKVLDRIKQGVINWKKVHLKVRHKFDRVINCNYVVDICSKQFGLKFVNISGMDIVEKNTHIIKSILWRIMRYQSIKIVSDLEFGSNINKVNNDVIIKWCNDKLESTFAQNMRCKQIKKLNDGSLTTGIYYLELMRAVMKKAINVDLIHFDVAPLSSSLMNKNTFDLESQDNDYKKRKQNLQYAMTIIRRYGVDLFINVTELFRLESRAVVSILAAVMTISLSTQHVKNDIQEKEEKKKDQEHSQNIVKSENKNNKSKPTEPYTPLQMENVDNIDVESILDSVDSLYNK